MIVTYLVEHGVRAFENIHYNHVSQSESHGYNNIVDVPKSN